MGRPVTVALEFCHFDGVDSTFVTFVAQLPSASVLSLLQVICRQQSVYDRNLAGGIQPRDAVGDPLTDVVEMWCFASDDATENDNGIVTSVKCHLMGHRRVRNFPEQS